MYMCLSSSCIRLLFVRDIELESISDLLLFFGKSMYQCSEKDPWLDVVCCGFSVIYRHMHLTLSSSRRDFIHKPIKIRELFRHYYGVKSKSWDHVVVLPVPFHGTVTQK